MIDSQSVVFPQRKSCSAVAFESILANDDWNWKAMSIPNSSWNPRFLTGLWNIVNTDTAIEFFMMYLSETHLFPGEDLLEIRKLVTQLVKEPWTSSQHYRIFEIKKKSGGTRTIEAPDALLKRIQRAILHTWIYGTDGPHSCVQGFVPKRGIKTNAVRHFVEEDARNRILLKKDFRDFFPSISRIGMLSALLDNRRHMMLSAHGWTIPPALRNLLRNSDLYTWLNKHGKVDTSQYMRLPFPTWAEMNSWVGTRIVVSKYREWEAHRNPCNVFTELVASMIDFVVSYICSLNDRLPQGSPCSPALANVFMRKFNANIMHLINTLNTKYPEFNLEYSIYADDMCVTGSTMKGVRTFNGISDSCIHDYPDISPNPEKTGIFKPGQTQCVTGCQITDRVSISRQRRDEVRAMLYMVAKGYKVPTEKEVAQLKGLRAWIIGIDPDGWNRRCERLYAQCNFAPSKSKDKDMGKSGVLVTKGRKRK